MIPIKLSLSGFLCYRDLVEINFKNNNMVIENSLLYAIVWALFGKVSKQQNPLIHPDVKAAEVTFQFQHEGITYRVQRTLPRGKTMLLEFHILLPLYKGWKSLTERTVRDTQAILDKTLRMDYKSFINQYINPESPRE